MYITHNKEFVRFDSMDEIDEYFPNNGFTEDRQRFISGATILAINHFPVYMKLYNNGPDATSIGLGQEYRLTSIEDIENTKNEMIRLRDNLTKTLQQINDILN